MNEKDWDDHIHGWRCDALRIPTATVDAVWVDGARKDEYEVLEGLHILRWHLPDHPPQAAISVKIQEELSTKELTQKWKQLAIVLPVVASLMTALIPGIFQVLPQLINSRLEQEIPGCRNNTPLASEPASRSPVPSKLLASQPVVTAASTSNDRACDSFDAQGVVEYNAGRYESAATFFQSALGKCALDRKTDITRKLNQAKEGAKQSQSTPNR